MILISFDIDGTLETGDPPGILTMEMVRRAQEKGFLIGSCSDRPISSQRRMWQEHQITVDFSVLKHQLAELKARFPAEEYYHVGDTELDHYFAERAGFHFLEVDAALERFWGSEGAKQAG